MGMAALRDVCVSPMHADILRDCNPGAQMVCVYDASVRTHVRVVAVLDRGNTDRVWSALAEVTDRVKRTNKISDPHTSPLGH